MAQTKIVVGGVYRHFKGELYRVKGLATHTETGDLLVIYKSATHDGVTTWARPLDMFSGKVDGKRRFELLDDSMPARSIPVKYADVPDSYVSYWAAEGKTSGLIDRLRMEVSKYNDFDTALAIIDDELRPLLAALQLSDMKQEKAELCREIMGLDRKEDKE